MNMPWWAVLAIVLAVVFVMFISMGIGMAVGEFGALVFLISGLAFIALITVGVRWLLSFETDKP